MRELDLGGDKQLSLQALFTRGWPPPRTFCPPKVLSFASSNMSGRQSKAPSQWPTSHPPAGSGATTPRHDTNALGTSNREQRTGSLLDVSSKLANLKRASSKGEPHLPLYLDLVDGLAVLASNLLPSSQEDHGVGEQFSVGVSVTWSLNRSTATVEEHLQSAGAKMFAKLERYLFPQLPSPDGADHCKLRVGE